MSRSSYINLMRRYSYSTSKVQDEPILFNIYNKDGDIIDTIRGTTNQRINKPRVINFRVNKHDIMIESEDYEIDQIYKKYPLVGPPGTTEKLNDELSKLRLETNWKLRVLNEEEEEMRIRDETLKAAETLIELSNSEIKKKRRNYRKMILELKSIRRSERLSKKKIKCKGCMEDQPNQMAHMGSNGCLDEDLPF